MIGDIFLEDGAVASSFTGHFFTPIPEHLTHLFSTTLENSVFYLLLLRWEWHYWN